MDHLKFLFMSLVFVMSSCQKQSSPTPIHSEVTLDQSAVKLTELEMNRIGIAVSNTLKEKISLYGSYNLDSPPACEDQMNQESFIEALVNAYFDSEACYKQAAFCADQVQEKSLKAIYHSHAQACAEDQDKIDLQKELAFNNLQVNQAQELRILSRLGFIQAQTFLDSSSHTNEIKELMLKILENKIDIEGLHELLEDETSQMVKRNKYFLVNRLMRQQLIHSHKSDLLRTVELHLSEVKGYNYYIYSSFFQLGKIDEFSASKKYYSSFHKTLIEQVNPDFQASMRQTFANETNSFTYDELYGDVCRTELSQGNEREKLDFIIDQWKIGQINKEQALEQATQLADEVGNKSDVLSFTGDILVLLKDIDRAEEVYWQAHKLCPYYERANKGLVTLSDLERYSQVEGYDEIDGAIQEKVASTEFQRLDEYLLNYDAFSEDELTYIKYGMWVWAPYIDFLLDNENYAYIKQNFELLSEAPGLEGMRNTRVTYEEDNRLWDDVRGLGGPVVVAEFHETSTSGFGNYNLLSHEVTHQFHQNLPEVQSNCIESMYEKAKETGNFPDGYSSTNSYEYFAQNMVYFLIPEGSPDSFGLNRSWVVVNDPDMFEWLMQIENGVEPVSLVCPL